MKFLALAILAAIGIAATTPFSVPASAQSIEPSRTTDAVRDDFIAAGYDASPATMWWTNRVTTFSARDASRDQILMVLVFPSLEAAQSERLQAAANDGDGNVANQHPLLVPGYGPSEWRGNVAIVQSSQSALARLYVAQYDDGQSILVRTGDDETDALAMRPIQVGRAVDADVLAILAPSAVVDL